MIRPLVLAALLATAAAPALAQTAPKDAALDAAFAKAAASDAMLRVLLQKMPKGADLHNHAGGSIYAEDLMGAVARAEGCYSKTTKALVAGPCDKPELVAMKTLVDTDSDLYSDIVDAISTRRFDQGVGDPAISGHRRFFWRRGGGAPPELGVAVSLEKAGQDKVLYLELMAGPRASPSVGEAAAREPWSETGWDARLAKLQPVVDAALPQADADLKATEAAARKWLGCGTAKAKPGCDVTLRYLTTVSRESQPASVFGQMAFAFALVNANPRVVGVNIAQPEDWPISTRDYKLHMRMFAFFKAKYPKVPMSLHAGEITLGLVEPRDLKFHIKDAVEVAGARRIGHGIDIAYEEDADLLLKRMARDKIAVEINITSNDIILGVKGAEHPLALYMAAGVPVAIATDDQGVARSDMTNEYQRAVTEQGLSYTQLRTISRDSLTYSFLEGESLWDASGKRLKAVCPAITAKPAAACAKLLTGSAKAREQWKLELALVAFEDDMRRTFAIAPLAKLPRPKR